MAKHLLILGLATSLILLVPMVAMRFSTEVRWTGLDFIAAGLLLFGAGLAYLFLAGRNGNAAYRVAAGLAVASTLFLIWVNLAVGLIGSEDNPANLMYFGVISVGLVAAATARFRPEGMARALFAMAIAQALIAVVALIGGWGQPASGPVEILGVNGLFIALFVASAFLFRRSARQSV